MASGLISTGLVLGIVFKTRHMTTAMITMKISEPKPCQSVPNCWTFSENDCFGTSVVPRNVLRSGFLVPEAPVVTVGAGEDEEADAGTSSSIGRKRRTLDGRRLT